MYIESLQPGNFYHIYNRGINGECIFREEKNYYRFLTKYQKYCEPVFNTIAYNLLGNHFHFVVRVKEDRTFTFRNGKTRILDPSIQLSHFFNSYAQSFNWLYDRTGGLFESPFHRKCILDNDYLLTAIFYTHNNARRHGFVENMLDWPYSSYHDLINHNKTFVCREWVHEKFGGRSAFIDFHNRALANLMEIEWMKE